MASTPHHAAGGAHEGRASGPYLSYRDVAALTGLRQATLRKYLAQGRLPPPDARIGNSPGWTETTIRTWLASRPGPGARTDLH